MNHFQRLVIPDDKNVYFCGDLHGNAELYDRTLREFGITDNDVVISVGDIIDRGPHSSRLAFEFLFKENRYMVMGNHEHMMVEGESRRDFYHCWIQNGGQAFLTDAGETGIAFFRQYFSQLPLILEVQHRGKKIGVVHGGVPTRYTDWDTFIADTKSMSWNIVEELIWERDTFDKCAQNNTLNAPRISGVDFVVSGHTGVVDPLIYGNRHWIDSMFMSGDITISTVQGNMLRHMRREKDEHSFDRWRR